MSYCDCEYDGDAPSFFSQGVVKARKPHRCGECYGPIAKGESYKRSSGKWDGRVDVYTECESCMELRQWAEISVTCFCCNVFGELHEKIREMVDDIRSDIPGFMFEWGRRIIKIERRRYGYWPRQTQRQVQLARLAAQRATRLANSSGIRNTEKEI